LRIVAFDRDLRTEQTLGEARTDPAGAYRIAYAPEAFRKAESGGADLLVRAFDAKGVRIAESAVRFNAGADEVIDLLVALSQKSEWERITLAVTPLLEGQDLLPDAFTDADIEFIVADAALDREQLAEWVWAYRAALAQPLVAPAPSPDSTLAAMRTVGDNQSGGMRASRALVDWIFYFACARNASPQDVVELLARDTEELLAVARRGVAANQVPASLLEFLKPLQAAIDRARVDRHLQASVQGEPARLGDILNTVARDWLDVNQRRKVVDLVARVDVEAPEFQDQARKSGLSARDARILTRSLRLAKIADGHLPAITALQPLLTDDNDATVAGLASVTPQRWLDWRAPASMPAAVPLSRWCSPGR